ncbi:PD-(D/E)XK nuclease-like domain-containing protein [Fructobacillus americanaquae]|uniref:PD-(D/E)XK nuclease-like domain-containing protein n=1 Tax=Fructobacillus americanaquae TaxID=2940302 RepID=A0ABY5C0J7_9LACO|nr:PD-(D/E)XK nuclease-like domain-containing protein [Fructobacillus americanaquae]USS92006.1 PD-(D/E)XK nuclease-like domain-containing protein [Fructobacillus americanaquae]
MSPTRAFKFSKNPLRAYHDYTGEHPWWEGSKDALLFGTIVHNVAEGRDKTQDISEEDKDLLISKAGKTKGQLKKAYVDAEVIGNHLRDYVLTFSALPFGQAEYEVEINEETETGQGVQFTATGRADMLTKKAVFDFKTVAPMDFDGFIEYGSFRDNRQEEYKKQIAYYAFMFDKKEAHLIYIKKDPDKPFIYDFKMDHDEILRYANEMADEIEQAVHYVDCPDNLEAINDGSQWAYEQFGGVIDV